MTPELVQGPADDPAMLAEAKAQCVVEHELDDALIASYIKAAVGHLDGYRGVLGFALEPQVWRGRLDAWPAGAVDLPVGPVTSIVAVTYRDAAGAAQVVPAEAYELVGDRLRLAAGASWPAASGGIAIEWSAGRGCPPEIRQAILMLVAHWYANREAVGRSAVVLPLGVAAIVNAVRRVGV